MSSLLYLIGGWAARRRWPVLITWLLLLIVVMGGQTLLGSRFDPSFSIPGTPAQVALDTMEQRFPAAASNASLKVIFEAPDGQQISASESTIAQAVSKIAAVPGVSSVQSPFDSTVDQRGQAISLDGTMAYATVSMDTAQANVTEKQYTAIREAAEAATANSHLTIAYSGMPDPPTPGDATEAIGMLISFVVLVITFGAFVAAGMPLLTAIIGVLLTDGLITLTSQVMNLSSTTPVLAEMLGLAVGIDYALFILSRHRSQLAKGMEVRESIAVAVATAGSAVLFAGTTVIIALLGLLIVGIPFLSAMGIGAAAGVLMSMLVAITLLPAIMSIAGKRLIPKAGSRASRRELATDPHTVGARWVKIVTAKPLVTLLVSVTALVLLALPALNMRLALPDAGADPAGSITRTGYDAMAAGWGPGSNGPLIAIADISHTDVTKLEDNLNALSDSFKSVKGVASVSQAIPNEALDAALVSITPTTAPDSVDTEALVHRLRDQAAAFESANGFSYEITGQTALNIDISQVLSAAILPFATVVVGLSLVLLLIVFRSVAVPISATGGFLLSVCAAFGVTTAIFQQGFLSSVFGLAKTGPIISFMPIMVMAVLFGLAMDYQVFLVSRMSEHFRASGDAHASVRSGFTAAARVVTAAALIMMSVFFSFVPGGGATIQPMALALAIGVGFDALIVRMTIIPALMWLLGDRAWSMPRAWRKLPDVDIEGAEVEDRREAWAWQSTLDPSVALAIEQTDVNEAFEARPGDVVNLIANPDAPVQPWLAAVTGRSDAIARLSALHVPLPFERGVVRGRSALVLPGTPFTPTTVTRQIRAQLKLNRVHRSSRAAAATLDLARDLARAALVPWSQVSPLANMSTLSIEQIWIIDLAIAVQSQLPLLAVDARTVPNQQAVVDAIVEHAPTDSLLVVATTEPVQSNRTVVSLNREVVSA